MSLPPPKSLEGTENVDTVWEMITKRFPNVAPLLCEMEAVIDRTEVLLDRLRGGPRQPPSDNQATFPNKKEELAGLSGKNEDRNEAANEASNQVVSNFNKGLEKSSLEGWGKLAQKAMCEPENEKYEELEGLAAGTAQAPTTPAKTEGPSLDRREPLVILEKYADRCQLRLEYECAVRPSKLSKNRRYVANGRLDRYTASGFGDTSERAKQNFAAQMLCQVMYDQMRNESTPPFADLSREEMLEVLNLDLENRAIPDTALTRLYRLCLERDEPLPVFDSRKCKTFEGLSLRVTCTALGYTGHGKAVSKSVAMKAATEDVYEKYRRDIRRS